MKSAKQLASYRKRREKGWEKQGILFRGKPLKWETFEALYEMSEGRCMICERIFWTGEKPLPVPDHDHKTGELRGILCSGKTGCNFSLLSRFERGKVFEDKLLMAVLTGYLRHPPVEELE